MAEELTIGVRALMSAIADLVKTKGYRDARVLPKINARGEMVIGVILPRTAPPPPAPDVREMKRKARERR